MSQDRDNPRPGVLAPSVPSLGVLSLGVLLALAACGPDTSQQAPSSAHASIAAPAPSAAPAAPSPPAPTSLASAAPPAAATVGPGCPKAVQPQCPPAPVRNPCPPRRVHRHHVRFHRRRGGYEHHEVARTEERTETERVIVRRPCPIDCPGYRTWSYAGIDARGYLVWPGKVEY